MKRKHQLFRLFYIMMIFFIIGILTSMIVLPAAAEPELSRYSVTPRAGEPDDTFVFLVTYNDPENTPPEYIWLKIDNKKYTLTPVNTDDNNYTDGKDYMGKTKLSEGIHIYYFEASDGNNSINTLAFTLDVKSEDEFAHLDVVYAILFATFIILIPIIYGAYQFRKLVRNLDKLVGTGERSQKKKNL